MFYLHREASMLILIYQPEQLLTMPLLIHESISVCQGSYLKKKKYWERKF